MRKALAAVVLLATFLILSQPLFAQSASQNQITLDEFVDSFVYDKQSHNFGDDFGKEVTFPSYYLKGVQLQWSLDDVVGVGAMLQLQFDAVNKVFPTTDGKTVTMEKFRVVLKLSPKLLPLNETASLIKKYETLFKSGSPTFEITAKLDGMNWGRSGKYPADTYGHFYVFLLIQSPTPGELETLTKDVFFIASDGELNMALRQKATMRGVALSAAFYYGLSEDKKKEVKELIQYVKDVHYRPIFVYGQPLNEAVVKELLDKDTSGCKPPFFVGILPTKRADNSEEIINMCGADSKERSEEWLKNYISNYWKYTKENLKKRGIEVLD